MKSATVFLVAVTMFTSLLLESSSTPIDWNSGGQVLGKIAENVGKVAQNTVAGVKNIVRDVTGDLKDLFSKLDGNFKDIVDIILKKAAIDIKTVTQGIGKLLGGVKVALKNLFEKLAALEGDVKDKVEIALGKVETAVVKAERLTKEILTAVEVGAVQKVEELKEKLLEAQIELKEAVEELLAIIEELLGEVGADVAALLATVKSFVAKLVKDVETAISKVLDLVGAVLGVRDEALQKLTYEKIQISEEAVDKLITVVKAVLAKLCGAEKETISKILEKLLSFKTVVFSAHVALKLGVDTGNNLFLEAIVISIRGIVEKTKADLAEIVKTIEELIKNADPIIAKILTKVLELIEAKVHLVIEDAVTVDKAIVELLAKRGYTAN